VGLAHVPTAHEDIADDGSWGSKPRGLLLSSCRFHTAPITGLVTCQDHSFFVSASEDGQCAVWLSSNVRWGLRSQRAVVDPCRSCRLASCPLAVDPPYNSLSALAVLSLPWMARPCAGKWR
jgi:hypothetical protein